MNCSFATSLQTHAPQRALLHTTMCWLNTQCAISHHAKTASSSQLLRADGGEQ